MQEQITQEHGVNRGDNTQVEPVQQISEADIEEQLKTLLNDMFDQKAFTENKYLVQRSTKTLQVGPDTILQENSVKSLLLPIKEEKKFIVFLNAVQKCEAVDFNTSTFQCAPKIKPSRDLVLIKTRSESATEIKELLKKYSEKFDQDFEIHERYQGQIHVIAQHGEEEAQKFFKWLFVQKLGNGSKIECSMEKDDVYIKSYFKLNHTVPTQQLQNKALESQSQQAIRYTQHYHAYQYQQQLQQQQYKYNNYGHFRGGRGNYNNNYRNNRGGYQNNNNRGGNHRQYPNQGGQHHNSNNNYNNNRGGGGQYRQQQPHNQQQHHQQNNAFHGIDDQNSFPPISSQNFQHNQSPQYQNKGGQNAQDQSSQQQQQRQEQVQQNDHQQQ